MKHVCSALILSLLCALTPLKAYQFDIVADFDPEEFRSSFSVVEKAGCTISSFDGFGNFNEIICNQISMGEQASKIDLIMVWNSVVQDNEPLFLLDKNKLVYLLWEPWELPSSYYNHFSKVYTWDDRLVDNVKFFKFYYPHLMPMRKELPDFREKRFCTMVVGHWTQNRESILRFFETKPSEDFDLYGRWYKASPLYRGSIQGYHCGANKINVLKQYKFCICFENSSFPGYISEKIFGCFAAGCVPVYWGAPNVALYIPKGCYVNYNDFSSDEELYSYLKNMTADQHEQYLNNIRLFLKSEQAQIFSRKTFERMLLEVTGLPKTD